MTDQEDINKEERKARRKQVTITLPQFLADHLRLWEGTGEPGPNNEIQSIQAWLSYFNGKTIEEVADTMRNRMLLLMKAASAIHNGGEEAEDSYGIYSEVSRAHFRDKQEVIKLHRDLAGSRLHAQQGWDRYTQKNKELVELRDKVANCPPAKPYDSNQREVMWFDPATGTKDVHPWRADEYRKMHGNLAWIYNPWTGKMRHPADIGTDLLGYLIVP